MLEIAELVATYGAYYQYWVLWELNPTLKPEALSLKPDRHP